MSIWKRLSNWWRGPERRRTQTVYFRLENGARCVREVELPDWAEEASVYWLPPSEAPPQPEPEEDEPEMPEINTVAPVITGVPPR